MGNFKREPGDKLRLGIQVIDETESFPMRVFVRLRDEFGNILNPNIIELEHRTDGYFTESYDVNNDTRAEMLDTPLVTAHYYFRRDDGLTNTDGSFVTQFSDLEPICNMGMAVHTYEKDELSLFIKDRLDQKISSIDNNPSNLFGVIGDSVDLIGVIDEF